MTAAMRSSVECKASESTPRLPVEAARKVFSDSRIMAEPTEPSAAICFADVALDLEISFPRIALPFCDYTTGREFARIAALGSCLRRTAAGLRHPAESARPEIHAAKFTSDSTSLQWRRRNERHASRLPVRAADFHLLEQQGRRNYIAGNAAVRAAKGPQRGSRGLRILALRVVKDSVVVADALQLAQVSHRQLRNQSPPDQVLAPVADVTASPPHRP